MDETSIPAHKNDAVKVNVNGFVFTTAWQILTAVSLQLYCALQLPSPAHPARWLLEGQWVLVFLTAGRRQRWQQEKV
jgi:hypothetical protein